MDVIFALLKHQDSARCFRDYRGLSNCVRATINFSLVGEICG